MATAPLVETERAPVERTEHPYVVKQADVLGGQPCVEGTRVPVRVVAGLFETGSSIEEIRRSYPTLTPAQIHDAISYALDHPDEIAEWWERNNLRSILRDGGLVYVEGRLLLPQQLAALKLPDDAVYYTWETLPQELDE
jgi:uncharacterized protein (DUF433 family)